MNGSKKYIIREHFHLMLTRNAQRKVTSDTNDRNLKLFLGTETWYIKPLFGVSSIMLPDENESAPLS